MVSKNLVDGIAAYAKAIQAEGATRGTAAMFRLAHVAEALDRASGPMRQRLGLDGGGLDVLMALRVAPPPHRLRPTALHRTLGITSGGLTARLNRLELAGLIGRSAAGDDRRGSWVALTEKGRRLAEQALAEEIALRAQVAQALSEREQWVLGTLLHKLMAHLSGPIAPVQEAP